MKPALSLQDARDMDFQTLVEQVGDILAEYDRPDVETPAQRIQRISRTLEEMPAHYRWLLQLRSWAAHWVDSTGKMFGTRDHRVQSLRQRRDLFSEMASAAKLRYEASSRLVTIDTEFTPEGLPRSRRGSSE